jgi:uncharacterized membrane protein
MRLKSAGTTFLNGLVIVAPVLITVYVVGAALWGLDRLVRGGLARIDIWPDWLTVGPQGDPIPGIGIVVGVVGIYMVGLLARSWLFGKLISIGESIVERIPLVKSLYSAVRDLLQFLGGTKAESRGQPAAIRDRDGTVLMLGLITQKRPQKFLPTDGERIAVYLPMSYQLGGYTVYVPPDRVEPMEGVSVEELMKLALTAGVGAAQPAQEAAEVVEMAGGEAPEGPRPRQAPPGQEPNQEAPASQEEADEGD